MKKKMTKSEFNILRQYALGLKFPITGAKAFESALQLTVV